MKFSGSKREFGNRRAREKVSEAKIRNPNTSL